MLTGRHASSVGVYDNAAELRGDDADGRPRPARRRLPHRGGREDALRRPRSAARLRGAADHRHLPRGCRLDAGLEPPLDEPLPWYHTMESVLTPGVTAASMQTDYDQEVAFLAARKLYEIARHRPDQPFLLFASFTNPHDPWEIPGRFWSGYARATIAARRGVAAARPRSIPTAAGCAPCAASTRRGSPRADPPCPPRLLRGDQLRRRADRRGARRTARFRAAETAPPSCSAPITERCSASVGSGTRCRSSSVRAGAIDRARLRRRRRRPAGTGPGVTARRRPDAARAGRPARGCGGRPRRWREPPVGPGPAP